MVPLGIYGFAATSVSKCQSYAQTNDHIGDNDRFSVVTKYALHIYSTKAHRKLVEVLYNKSTCLAYGGYVGRNGIPCRLVQGPQGIGKSTVLESFANVCRNLFPDVIPVYLSFDNPYENELHRLSLIQLVGKELQREKLLDVADGDFKQVDIVNTLEKHFNLFC